MHLKLICPKIYIGGVFWLEGPKMEKRGVLLKKSLRNTGLQGI